MMKTKSSSFSETTCYVRIYLNLHYFLTFDTRLSHWPTVKFQQRYVSHRLRSTNSSMWLQRTIRYHRLTIKPTSESSTRKLIGIKTHIYNNCAVPRRDCLKSFLKLIKLLILGKYSLFIIYRVAHEISYH